jgi:hypothetical protein
MSPTCTTELASTWARANASEKIVESGFADPTTAESTISVTVTPDPPVV